ncbi:MAG: gamma-glutamyl-gamma-aminobutyrate hydrolase family protein [Caldilineaceae bacterium]
MNNKQLMENGATQTGAIQELRHARRLGSHPERTEEDGARNRPLIGVPTGREKSQRFFGLPLYIMNQTYIRVLETLGALPVMIPLQMSEATLHGIFGRLDGLFLPGGEDINPACYGAAQHPQLGATDVERDRTELLLTRWAIEAGMPVLGVCRGIQVINVVCGGTLVQDLHSECPELEKHDYTPPAYERFRLSHTITIEPDSQLAHTLGTTHEVNSMHHQAIARLGAGLRVVGRAEDTLPEAVEIPALPFVVGVQWHPEELAATDQCSRGLFYAFVAAAAGPWRDQVPPQWRQQFTEMVAAGTEALVYSL